MRWLWSRTDENDFGIGDVDGAAEVDRIRTTGCETAVAMRIGALLMPTDPWDDTIRLVARLESLGYDHVWVYDHLSWRRYRDRPWHATYPWLAGLAVHTSQIRLGTMVANLNLRHPLVLAKDAMTLDHISGGRFTLGLGAGGTGFDAAILGQRPLSRAQRVDRLAEATRLLDGLLRDEVHNHDEEFYTVKEGRVLPGCVQEPRVPFAIAAGGRRALSIVAAYGDAWITWGDTSLEDLTADGTERVVAGQLAHLESACESIGRDPTGIDRIFRIGNTDARPLRSAADFEAFARRYESMGFTDLVFHMPRPDDPVWNDDPDIVNLIAPR